MQNAKNFVLLRKSLNPPFLSFTKRLKLIIQNLRKASQDQHYWKEASLKIALRSEAE